MRNLSSGLLPHLLPCILLNVPNLVKRLSELFVNGSWILYKLWTSMRRSPVNLGHFKAFQQKYQTYLIIKNVKEEERIRLIFH